MTDSPRFRPVKCGPEEAWRDYHGAPLVDLAFRIADAWPRGAERDERRGIRHALIDRRELARPMAGLAWARAAVLAAVAAGLAASAIALTDAADPRAARFVAVSAHADR